MASYINYPEYENFAEELDRKKALLNSIIEEYEVLQKRVQDMQGYQQVEDYISEMKDTYNLLLDCVDIIEQKKSELIYS